MSWLPLWTRRQFAPEESQGAASTDAYRLSRVRLHEAFARLFLYKGVNDSVTIQEATTNTVQELESVLPTAAPAGCRCESSGGTCTWVAYQT